MQKPDILLPIVAPIGIDKLDFIQNLKDELDHFGYISEYIQISQLMGKPSGIKSVKHEHERIDLYIRLGNEYRELTDSNDIFAYFVVREIQERRSKHNQDKLNHDNKGVAYIIDSLKHPLELQTLRMIYGNYSLCISLCDYISNREQNLTDKINSTLHNKSLASIEAQKLIERDLLEEYNTHGQRVGDVFHDSDVFLKPKSSKEIKRFLNIWFNNPIETPCIQEYAMQVAYSTARCSGDLSRQVGAVIISPNGELISTGFNEVPHLHGHAYWSGITKEDWRDKAKNMDQNQKEKSQAIHEFVELLGKVMDQSKFTGMTPAAMMSYLEEECPSFANSRLNNLIEFGSIVHAEMYAIINAVRRGTSVQGATLVCTTFPCHMCARHIIASGIKKVIYIEPYSKSMALELYKDQIIADNGTEVPGKLLFEQFDGVGPRRYNEFFEIRGNRRKDKRTGAVLHHDKNALYPHYKSFADVREFERLALRELQLINERSRLNLGRGDA